MKEENNGKEKPESIDVKEHEDTTKYPEFIPTFESWVSPDDQKKRAEELEETDN